MWLLVARERRPDAPDWPGRRLLASVDAVGWPLFWVGVFIHMPKPRGIVFAIALAVALLVGIGRLHCALWTNHRYRFATWRWLRVCAGLLLGGVVVKLAVAP